MPELEELEESVESSTALARESKKPVIIRKFAYNRVLKQAKNQLPQGYLSLLREKPAYFEGTKARLRVGQDGRVLEVQLISEGPLHDRRYRAVRLFFRSLKFFERPGGGEIWVEFKLNSPFLL